MIRAVAGALLIASISLCTQAASRADTPTTMIVGTKKPMGAGQAWSWVRKDADGKITSFGVSFTDGALQKLGGESELPLSLPAPPAFAFRTAVIDWHPHGHPPAHVYDVPHLDFHFYTIAESRRMKITDAPPNMVAKPSANAVPKGYITDGAVVAMMGMHYVPAAAPEFNGGRFTATPIYGYDQGQLAFVESMATLSYLKTKPNLSARLAQPAAFPLNGGYPTTWGIRYDSAAHRYDVEFGTLMQRVAQR